jgi:hypothetical protein
MSQERNYHEVVTICLQTRNLLEQFDMDMSNGWGINKI